MAAPKDSGGNRRTSTCMPPRKRKLTLFFATRNDLHQAGQLDDVFDQFIALGFVAAGFAGDENIEIADGFASAAQGSGRSNFLHAGKIFQVIDNFLRLALSSV